MFVHFTECFEVSLKVFHTNECYASHDSHEIGMQYLVQNGSNDVFS